MDLLCIRHQLVRRDPGRLEDCRSVFLRDPSISYAHCELDVTHTSISRIPARPIVLLGLFPEQRVAFVDLASSRVAGYFTVATVEKPLQPKLTDGRCALRLLTRKLFTVRALDPLTCVN